jgi:hypothetical protein
MIKIDVYTMGSGYSGFSAGILGIIVRKNDFFKSFEGFCQGLSSSKFFIYDVPVKNEIQDYDASVLLDLNLFDFKLEIPTLFGLSNPVEFDFQLFESYSTEPIFKVSRRASAWGFSFGSISVLGQTGQMRLVEKGSWSSYQERVGKELKEDVRRDRVVATMM